MSLSEQILKYLSENDEINTIKLANILDVDHQKIVGALKSIEAQGNLINSETVSEKHIELTEEGKLVADTGK